MILQGLVDVDGIVTGDDDREYGTAAAIGRRLQRLGHANGAALIRKWRASGHLAPQGQIGRQPVYAVADVMTAERVTRQAKTRRGGRPRLTA